MSKKIDLMGQQFGSLIVIDSSPWHKSRRRTHWVCQCHCGRKLLVRYDNLLMRRTTQCSICRGYSGRPSVFIEEGDHDD